MRIGIRRKDARPGADRVAQIGLGADDGHIGVREGCGNRMARVLLVAPQVLQFARDVRRDGVRNERIIEGFFGRNHHREAARLDLLARAPDSVEALEHNGNSLLELRVTGGPIELPLRRPSVTEIAFGIGSAVLREYAQRN